ncbi:MAG: hypothetical protein JW947_02145 [Sedimentisphaerales bacterium]|nr:hypothetical protein [Sedimentisphaerales bacterium]
MKTGRILTIVFLVLGLTAWSAVSTAASIGTAFTYQGQLYDANHIAYGVYDFQFKLFNASVGTTQLGPDVNKPNVDVIDGYFTVELDFGSGIFDGSIAWLEIGVRQGELDDPNGYTTLSPRQEVTPTPYAIYAESAPGDTDWVITGSNMYSGVTGNVGIGITNPIAKLEIGGSTDLSSQIRSIRTGGATAMFGGGQSEAVVGTYSNHPFVISTNLKERIRVDTAGNVGIGTTSPTQTLDVDGKARIAGDTYIAGILNLNEFSNTTYIENVNDGMKFWVDTIGSPICYDFQSPVRSLLTILDSGNIGIGTTSPTETLDVNGTAKATAFVGDGSGLTNLPATPDTDWTISGSHMYSAVSGNVGIGTTSPTQKLHVQDSAAGALVAKIVNTGTVNSLGLSIETGSSDSSAAFRVMSAGSMIFLVSNSGKVGVKTLGLPANEFGVNGAAAIGISYASNKTAPANGLLVQGAVGIGTDTPARMLHVSDTMRLEPRATAPSSPAEGDMYMSSTTHKLMVYDGTTWQACW